MAPTRRQRASRLRLRVHSQTRLEVSCIRASRRALIQTAPEETTTTSGASLLRIPRNSPKLMNTSHGGLRAIFRATAILSASSFVTILVGLVTSKVYAVLLGPKGYGYIGLLQSMMNLTILVAGLGVGSAVVRIAAGRIAEKDEQGTADILQGAYWLLAVACFVAVLLIVLFRRTLSVLFLGSSGHPWAIVFMVVPIVLMLFSRLNTSVLNAYHRVDALARNTVFASVLGGTFSILVIVTWRTKGVVAAITADSILAWYVAHRVLRKEIGTLPRVSQVRSVLRAASSLVKFGGPYTLSMMAGTGVQLALPILVLHMLGGDAVGYYRAAISVSVTYLGFIVTAMAQDYFPRVAAASRDSEELGHLINKQQRVVLLLGVPVILTALALVPVLVPLVYSFRFLPTIDMLEWQLIGDIFKYSSWTMSFAILARCSSATYFLAECVGGVSTLGASWLGMRLFGLTGLGISFVVAYAIYYLVVWIIIRREIDLVLTASNVKLFISAVGAAAAIRLISSSSLGALRGPIAIAIAALAAVVSIIAISREFQGSESYLRARSAVARMTSFALPTRD